MRIHFIGAAQTVTGSMHLVETKRGRVLLDCGLFQGKREEARAKNQQLSPDALTADALVLSHAHTDHSGSIPTLVKRGFRGDIFGTPATRDLCAYMLRDSAHIQVSDAEYLNRSFGGDPNWKPIEPLYDDADAIRAMTQFKATPYGRPFDVLPGVRARFFDAGHILGSAGVLLEIDENLDGKVVRLAFSGDIGRTGMPILRDPEPPTPPIDYLLMESTYGDRVHADIHDTHEQLGRVVDETARRGGKVIVPAFAVGRTQEIIYSLNQLRRENRLVDIPIFIDSPLGVNVTDVFKLHPECFDEEARHFLDEDGALFDGKRIKYVRSIQESMALNSLAGPAIIIASSGMCEAGRVLHHLKHNIEDANSCVLIVGYQAENTLGRRLVEGQKRVRILGVEKEVRARVEVMTAFSAHADKNGLLAYAMASGKEAKRVFLVHGEPEQQHAFEKVLGQHGLEAAVPAAGEVFEA